MKAKAVVEVAYDEGLVPKRIRGARREVRERLGRVTTGMTGKIMYPCVAALLSGR
jgi:hypothetical protein